MAKTAVRESGSMGAEALRIGIPGLILKNRFIVLNSSVTAWMDADESMA